MNDNTWVAVDPAELKAGDKVRLVHDNGDIIHGTGDGNNVHLLWGWQSFTGASGMGYRFEREQSALPTSEGLYGLPGDDARLFNLNGDGRWVTDDGGCTWRPIDTRNVPITIHRLVPSTEADELRARIDLIRLAVQTGRIALAGVGNRDLLMQMLDGGSK